MTITATVLEDSLSPEGIRLTTFQLRYPRFIHSELMTHRVFSRNASSSRAIPIMRMIRNTVADMAEPVAWGRNKPGMQAGKNLTGFRRWIARRLWRTAGWTAAGFAYLLAKSGVHKQIANRVIEPWSHISVVVTSTDFSNWFKLRDHEDADPTIKALAQAMRVEFDENKPKDLMPGEWHLPYLSEEEKASLHTELARQVSAARCARVSYLTHDNQTPSLEADYRLFEQLMGGEIQHASPTEHQATPDKLWSRGRWAKPELHGNLHGWRQFRKEIEV
jgi:hypothetical protein